MYRERGARVCQQPAEHLLVLPKSPHLVIYVMELLMHERGSSTFQKSKGRTLGLITEGTSFRPFEHPMRIQDKTTGFQL